MSTELHRFQPEWQRLGSFPAVWPSSELLAVRGVYAADEALARQHGGPVIAAILDAIPDHVRSAARRAGLEANIDVRVHQLEHGDYPASPGWHCDDPIRETAFDDRADRVSISGTLLATAADHPSGISPTEVWTAPMTAPVHAETGSARWRTVDTILNAENGELAEPGVLHSLGTTTLHRATPAVTSGRRVFLRLSWWQRPPGHVGGVSRIEQVYRLIR